MRLISPGLPINVILEPLHLSSSYNPHLPFPSPHSPFPSPLSPTPHTLYLISPDPHLCHPISSSRGPVQDGI